jgi:hypothetical protein
MDGEGSEPTYVLQGREALTPVFDDLNRGGSCCATTTRHGRRRRRPSRTAAPWRSAASASIWPGMEPTILAARSSSTRWTTSCSSTSSMSDGRRSTSPTGRGHSRLHRGTGERPCLPWKHFIGGHNGRLGTRDDVTVHQQYMAEIGDSVRTAVDTVDPTPYFQKYGENTSSRSTPESWRRPTCVPRAPRSGSWSCLFVPQGVRLDVVTYPFQVRLLGPIAARSLHAAVLRESR